MFLKILRSTAIWFGVTLLTVFYYFFILFLLIFVFPFDKKRSIAHIQCSWWAFSILALNPWIHIRVSGLENIEKHRTYIIVANHQSSADIIITYKIGIQFKWVAKKSLFNVPFMGWGMSLAKYITLSRGSIGSIKNAYRQISYWLRSGISVVFFPEGTRATTGKLIDFKNGAFKLAIKEKVPILPVTINGTKNIIPKGSWLFESRTNCSVKILPAIETSQLQSQDFDYLRELVRRRLEEASI